jgi:hypothetical protein
MVIVAYDITSEYPDNESHYSYTPVIWRIETLAN